MTSDDIIRALVTGNRDLIDDANEITATDGLASIEVHHRSSDGESTVVLTYDAYMQFRRDPDDPMHEFDLFGIAINPAESADFLVHSTTVVTSSW